MQLTTFLLNKWLVEKIEAHQYNNFLSELSIVEAAKIRSSSVSKASSWLNVVPNKSLGFLLNNSEFGTLIRSTLNLEPVIQEDLCLYCQVNHFSPDHPIECKKGGDFQSRHNAICQVIYDLCSSALHPIKEKKGILPDLSKPADVFIPNWINGKALCIDVSIASVTCKTVVFNSSKSTLYAANLRNGNKVSKYGKHLNHLNISFLPFILETSGAMTVESAKFLKRICSLIVKRSNIPYYQISRNASQKISFLLQKHLASSFLKRSSLL